MSYPTLKAVVQNCKLLSGFVKPAANMYAGAAAYRQIGLRYDDLLAEESEVVQEALRRLEIANPKEAYDRAYRLRVAQQCSLSHQLLPQAQWVTPKEDVRYLQPYIDEVAAERAEREAFDNIKVAARH
ncbi:cytochrome b-c1 complex subunit 7 [Radiomyces spectabilis]|uniref:cytochrome b-c1 complex subunit 7 n=1 Tax=Radiomyces spectabilis TaxID=64574 RepID=UPI00221E58B3|nr:cytochrome b-c1 complex subunit 7 [Radiomyces spectabilis]KAI8374362.1 cytochrome b-c1 complex subunit 7 [Radiomyces spectabilis]